MEFYRNVVYCPSLNDTYLNYIFNQFNNFGFCRRDGSPLVYEGLPTGYDDRTTKLQFRWSKDAANEVFFQFWDYYDNQWGSVALYNIKTIGRSTYESFSNSHNYITTIFIPLKNNNFLLQQYNPQNKNITAPPFITAKTATNSNIVTSAGQNNISYFLTTISFKNNISILKPYCYFLNYGRTDQGGYGRPQPIVPLFNINSDIFKMSEGPVKYLNRQPINETPGDPAFITHDYNNINQNICTLIRIPQDNGFFDGLYLCTTYPCDQIEGKVFSFNGRSFLGVYENLVVELPAN